jgi:hypothetical protein
VDVKPIKGRHGTFYSIVNDSYIGRSLEEYGEWGQGEMHIYETLIKKDSIVVEIGSHIGSLPCLFLDYVKLFLPSSHKDYCFNYLIQI